MLATSNCRMPSTLPLRCRYVIWRTMCGLDLCLQAPSLSWSCHCGNSTPSPSACGTLSDIEPAQVAWDQIKAIVRDHAWHELPAVMQFKVRPAFESVVQHFLLPQSDGKVCLLKVKGAYVQTLLQGQGYELQWGAANKKLARKGFQWLLEQVGGSQILKYCLGPEVRAVKSNAPEPDEAAWSFLMEHGEMDKGGLKQLRWTHAQINDTQSPNRPSTIGPRNLSSVHWIVWRAMAVLPSSLPGTTSPCTMWSLLSETSWRSSRQSSALSC